MKTILTICIFLGISLFNEGYTQKINIENIYGVWYRSYEEDKDSIMVFRPMDFKFPPIRARERVEIKENKQIVETRISPTDALLNVKGNFSYCSKHNELTFSFNDKEEPKERRYKIVQLDKSILKVQYIDEE